MKREATTIRTTPDVETQLILKKLFKWNFEAKKCKILLRNSFKTILKRLELFSIIIGVIVLVILFFKKNTCLKHPLRECECIVSVERTIAGLL